jgi:hypothetical protein
MYVCENMQTKEVEGDRDTELENVIGNLMIAQYQVQKIRTKLAGKIEGYHHHFHNTQSSTFAFKDNEKWYRVSIRVDEISNDKKQFFIKQKYEDDND